MIVFVADLWPVILIDHKFFFNKKKVFLLKIKSKTETQFQRVLDQILKSALTHEQIDLLADKYDLKNNSTVNYREFCNAVNRGFPENDLRDEPSNNVFKNPEYLGTFRSKKQLGSNEENSLRSLLTDLNNYYSKKNLDLLPNFRDFDRNNIGVITESQVKLN